MGMKECKCGKQFKLNGSLYNHIKAKHDNQYQEFKISQTKRGRPKKQNMDNQQIEKYKSIKYSLEIDQDGKQLVKIFDTGILDSESFRKLLNSFREQHSHLIYEKQTSSCNYLKFSKLFNQYENDNQNQRMCVEVVAFVQMLQPDIQQEMIEYLYWEIKQQKYQSIQIPLELQRSLTQIMKDVYKINNESQDLEINTHTNKLPEQVSNQQFEILISSQ